MEREADFTRLQNNLILSLSNMLLEIEKTGKETLDRYGFPE